MNWRHLLLSSVIITMIVFVSVGLSKDWQTYRQDRATVRDLEAQLLDFQEENEGIKDDIKFYSDSANLAKELRARFNYKQPGEELLIIVPEN